MEALRTALEDVGPHWSIIISRYGNEGTVNQSLKARDAMGCFNKATYMKKRLLETGKKVPQYLQDVKVGTWSNAKGSGRDSRNQHSDEDEEGRPRRTKRRTRRKTKEGPEPKVKVKEEEAMVISDDSDDEGKRTNWNELPSSTPKSRRKHGASSQTMASEPADDPELEELRMIMMTRRREEAEQAFRMREAKLRKTHQR